MSDPKERDLATKQRLMEIAKVWYDQMDGGDVPSITLPTRTKYNIEYDDASEVWTYGSKESTRNAGTAKSAIHMLKMAYVIAFIKMQLAENRSSTLREMYYISEGWKQAKFHAQNESNYLVEDLEIITNLQREYFHMRPEEDGASIFGPLRVRENTRRGMKEIHCQDDVGEAGYNIPNNVENVELVDHNATCVIALETGGMFSRLQENGFDEEYNTILLHLKGQPTRATRRMLKRMNEELKIPVVVFTDGDPWSYRIYASVAYGSIKAAHMSEFLATPSAQFIGVKPSDIRDYNLPADKLTEQDVNALKAELSDPRFGSDFWKKEINLQLEMGLKSEQQAFASHGLDFVTKEYLPAMLSEIGVLKR
ncbi:DNA topoisomerase IV subunit A [Methanocorpusculum vombati]|uniref:Type 2 DNA topoisomerase 6 subunit A n=1 Tax=Methanocorpusculum vombati TaxID=3002864 RepID=A0ABT4IKQ8_9EURY|nr:DNA topoisomerase IV subunit A [Methanocorpusculum vombati]MCZ0862322.1 DNA topoisomerase IV subunit A [Methanocorpusculum vombati]MDE2519832.1 DNA topoisomerase IV subunit A [Methanocorpusculum sp.]MDE2535218.1 DNA topoisomerase IV subunit A [Methanocorpusculum sp.]